ncbi:MAG: SIR2 family protein [Proteobacteria bacterium]|uniref:SIR2 family protein n=1 Tax=Agrobacterium salinitolerans TaxID=1183413 RepID=UPI001D9ECEF0|nr:SIR2 family protein [Agrobacterium salinitolerans]MBS0257006.1 SIR2 family protein [Pseudomonadota bacterium]MCZ7853721.1 SIR2 family protein [Agrobacterium salinitolerans]
MTTSEFPKNFDPSRCVLFLGAGFSADALNKAGGNPPVGRGLEKEVKKLAKLDEDDSSDLLDAAGYALAQGTDLYELLDGLYTIRTITPLQRAVLAQPWRRIYTTNYDNSVSVFRTEQGKSATNDIFDIADDVPRQLRQGAVVHLHGSIAKCQPNNVDESLVLSRRSYVEQRVRKSAWWEWFDRDVRISQFIFFLGYDLNDFEPASYLIKYPGLKNVRHFILRNAKSPVASSKLADYGVRHSFEMAGFVDRLINSKVMPSPKHENELQAFRYVDLSKDNKLLSKPTSAEIQELLAFGKLRFEGVRATAPGSEYVVFREKTIDRCIDLLSENVTLVIHSKIGNGKSVLATELKIVMTQSGWNCFEIRENITPPPQDLEFLGKMEKVIVFFPSYDSAVANTHLFAGMHASTRYVVEMQTSTLQVRLQEVNRLLGKSVARINVDQLDGRDSEKLRSLLAEAGLSSLAKSDRINKGLEFRDFLLAAFDEPEIAARLRSIIEPMLSKREARKVVCASAIFKAAGQQVDTSFIEDATGEDPYTVMTELGEKAWDLFRYDIDQIEPHSAVVSEHLLKKYVSPKDFTDEILNLAREAARRLDESDDYNSERFRRARALLSSILRFSFIESVIGKGPDKRLLVKKVYEGCRRDELVKKEPLFWLQYCIFWQDEQRWDLAESHMAEAYERGSARPGFKFYQLDTNNLGLLCDIERFNPAEEAVSRFDKIIEAMEKCREMVDDGNHRNHVIKAFLKVEAMVKARVQGFTQSQATTLTYGLNLVVQKLEALTPSERAIWGTDPCRDSLKSSVNVLIERRYS